MNIQNNNEKNERKFDLEERIARFGEEIIIFAKKIPRSPVTLPLITQMVKSGTSVGANYNEADNAESRADFKHKIGICKKEPRETKHWLRMIKTALIEEPDIISDIDKHIREATELNLIFNAIVRSTNANTKIKKL